MRSFELVAPRVGGCKLPCLQDGLLWEVPVARGPDQGWGLWHVEDHQASYLRPAAAWERERCLVQKPRTVLTLLEDRGSGTWSATGPGRRMVTVHLVDQGAALDGVRAVHDGLRWWCVGLAPGKSRRSQRWRGQLAAGEAPPDLKPGYRGARVPHGDGQRIRRAVELAGGQLVAWEPTPHGFRVRWRREGAQHDSLVDRQLNLQQAGFCLANTDSEHDLTSLVSLIRERSYQEGWS